MEIQNIPNDWIIKSPVKEKISKSERIKKDDYFLKIAMVVAERSTCMRHHVGAVAVKEGHIIATGYNGSLSGFPHCLELNCVRNQLKIPSGTRTEICRAIHAEQNVIIQCALHGKSIEGAAIYCTHTPCVLCAKMLANSKIKRFVTYVDYPDPSFLQIFKQAGIEFVKLDKPDREINELQ